MEFTRYCDAESFQIPTPEGAIKTAYKLKKNLATCCEIFLLFLFHRELTQILFCHCEVLDTKWAWKDIKKQKWYVDGVAAKSSPEKSHYLQMSLQMNMYDPDLIHFWMFVGYTVASNVTVPKSKTIRQT